MRTQVAVLGGGPGGYSAAFMAADLGMQVTLVESDASLGGTCLLRGCIPSKTLLHVARAIAQASEVAEWGVTYAAPQLNLDALRTRKDKVVSSLAAGLAQLAKQRKVTVVRARGSFVDSSTLRLEGPDVRTEDDARLSFDHAILATGSRPTIPQSLNIQSPRVFDSTGALILPDVSESLLVIGGGYIGLEMATVYSQLGSKVSVVERANGLLPGVDRDLVTPLQRRLEPRLAKLGLNTSVSSLTDAGDGIEAVLDGLGGQERLKFGRVLIAVGRHPSSDGIGLENTRVQVDARGFVQVDRQCRTFDERILAVGDVAGEPMLAHKAMRQAKVAAEVLAGGAAEFDPRAIPAVVYTDPEIAWAGLTEEAAAKAGVAVKIARYPWAASGRASSLGRTEGMTKLLADAQTDRVLGVGIVGLGAGDLIAEGVLAIEMGCTVRDVSESIHPHPTMSESIGIAAEAYLGVATDIYRPQRK